MFHIGFLPVFYQVYFAASASHQLQQRRRQRDGCHQRPIRSRGRHHNLYIFIAPPCRLHRNTLNSDFCFRLSHSRPVYYYTCTISAAVVASQARRVASGVDGNISGARVWYGNSFNKFGPSEPLRSIKTERKKKKQSWKKMPYRLPAGKGFKYIYMCICYRNIYIYIYRRRRLIIYRRNS